MATDTRAEARSLVRSYSFEVEPRFVKGTHAHTLGQALVEEMENGSLDDVTTPWRAFFEPKATGDVSSDPVTDIIRDETSKLREKCVTFYQRCPKEERLDLSSYDTTITGVTAMVNAVAVQWQNNKNKGRAGKAMTFFHKFCGTLNSHSSLIELLPDGNEYVSIFTGSLNVIIKASANYVTIAEGFAEGLCTISEHIEEVARYMTLLPTEEVTKRVVDLYGHVFQFLSSVMDWITKKSHRRMLNSFSENFNDRFCTEINKINDRAARIRNTAFQSAMAENRVNRLYVERLERHMRSRKEDDLKNQAERQSFTEEVRGHFQRAEEDRRLEAERMRHLGGCVVIFLEADAVKRLQAGDKLPSLETAASSIQSASSFQSLSTMPTRFTDGDPAEDIALNSRHLEGFFSRERIRFATDSFIPTSVGSDLAPRLSEWAQDQHDPILWLEGPAIEVDDTENPLTSLAAKFIDLVVMNKLPVISYFCEIPQTVDSNVTREAKGTVSLLYALLRQVVELLLPRLETALDLSEERFLGLDGTLDTWPEALGVFRDLVMSLAPGTVYCVVDGLHWLDDKTTDLALAQLVECLRGGTLKVLFTTSGRSGCLLECLEPGETFVVGEPDPDDAFDGLDGHGVLD